MENSNFLLLDTETTGISPEEDCIVEIGWMIVSGKGDIVKPCTSSLCQSEKPIPPEASAVHHIVDSMLYKAPTLRQVINNINTDCTTASVKAIVCHNLKFDGPMLGKSLTDEDPLSYLDGICTLRLSRKVFSQLTTHSLQVLRYSLDLDSGESHNIIPHRAKADVIILAKLFQKLIDEIKITNYHDFLRYADTPFVMQNMPFGKYKGELIDKLPLSYKEWLLKLPELDADLRYTVRHSLGLK